jgi:hypothetical protein
MKQTGRAILSRTLLCALTAAARSAVLAQEAPSQFQLGTWDGRIEGSYDTEHQRQSSPGTASTKYSLDEFRELVTVRNSGFYYIDPRLATGSLGLTFGQFQTFEDASGTHIASHGTLTGYSFDASILPVLPYSAYLSANRSENVLSQPFGRTDLTFEGRSVRFHLAEDSVLRERLGIPFLSANLWADQQVTHETTTSAIGQTFQRDETRSALGFDGHNGFRTSDLDWHYEFTDYSDAFNEQNNFRAQTASLNYSLDFGHNLNWHWDARQYFYSRDGLSRYSTENANETLRLEHSSNLSSTYTYVYTHSDTAAGVSASQAASAAVAYRPYLNLATNAQVSGARENFPEGKRDNYAAKLNAQYRHDLPGKGTFTLLGGGGIEVDDNKFAASEIRATDEPHTAPSALGGNAGPLLNQPFAVESTVVVVDTRGGSRLPTALGVDYEILVEGDYLRIVPLITSAVIQPGDTLAISYSYNVDASIKYRTLTQSAGASVDYGWISAAIDHEQSEQSLLSGHDSQFLTNVRQDVARLDLRGGWRSIWAQAGAQYTLYDATRLAYRQQRYYESTVYRVRRTLDFTASADWTLTHYTLPVYSTNTNSEQAGVNWRGSRGIWTMTGLLSRRVFRSTLQPTETVNEASLTGKVEYGKLTFTSTFAYDDRTLGSARNDLWRFLCTLARNL